MDPPPPCPDIGRSRKPGPAPATDVGTPRLEVALQGIRARLQELPGEPDGAAGAGFLDTVQDLLRCIGGVEHEESLARLHDSGALAEFREFFGPRILTFTWAMESRSHAEIMRRRTESPSAAPAKIGDLIGPHTRGAYGRMGDVLDLVDLSRCRRFVMTGCGIVPGCLFHLHDWTTIRRLVGIERDPDALRLARDLVEALGLDRRIEIVADDACAFDYGAFDVIYWDPFAVPRAAVMERIVATARPDATIILRDPFLGGSLFFEPMIGSLHPRFRVVAESEGFPGRFMLKHHVLRIDG